jgi:hypothetical protein
VRARPASRSTRLRLSTATAQAEALASPPGVQDIRAALEVLQQVLRLSGRAAHGAVRNAEGVTGARLIAARDAGWRAAPPVSGPSATSHASTGRSTWMGMSAMWKSSPPGADLKRTTDRGLSLRQVSVRPLGAIGLKLVGFTRQSYPAVPGPPSYVCAISSNAFTARNAAGAVPLSSNRLPIVSAVPTYSSKSRSPSRKA